MESLTQLLARHPRLLVIDTASTTLYVGLPSLAVAHGSTNRAGPADRDGNASHYGIWRKASAEALDGLFPLVQAVLTSADLTFAEWDACVFCEGPGSILGIRAAAMALRTWHVVQPRPLYSYQSLAVVAAALPPPALPVIADARRQSWHRVSHPGAPLERVPAADVQGPGVMPAGFRHWSPLPPDFSLVPYDLPRLLAQTATLPLFSPSPEPDAFLHEAPAYATWTARIHQAPAPSVPHSHTP